jgi:hypothetical protein
MRAPKPKLGREGEAGACAPGCSNTSHQICLGPLRLCGSISGSRLPADRSQQHPLDTQFLALLRKRSRQVGASGWLASSTTMCSVSMLVSSAYLARPS